MTICRIAALSICILVDCAAANLGFAQAVATPALQLSPSQRLLNSLPAVSGDGMPDWVGLAVSPQHARAMAALVAARIIDGQSKYATFSNPDLDVAVQVFRAALTASGSARPLTAFSSRLAGGVHGASGTSSGAMAGQFNLTNRLFAAELARGIQAASVLSSAAGQFSGVAGPALQRQVRYFLDAKSPSLSTADAERYGRFVKATSTTGRRAVLEEDGGSLPAALLAGAPPELDRALARNLLAQHAGAPVSAGPNPPADLDLWKGLAAASAINEHLVAYHRALLGAPTGNAAGLRRTPFVTADLNEGLWDPYGFLGAASPRPPPWGASTTGEGGLFPTQPLRQYVDGMWYPGAILQRTFRQRFTDESQRFGTLLTGGADELGKALPHLRAIGVSGEVVDGLGRVQNLLVSGGAAFTGISAFATVSSFGTFFPMVAAVGALGGALFGDGGIFGEGSGNGGGGAGGDALGGALTAIYTALLDISDRLENIEEQLADLRQDVRELSRDMQQLHQDMLTNFDQVFGQLAFLRRDMVEVRDLVLAQTDRDIGLCELAIGIIDQNDRRLTAAMASPSATSRNLRLFDPYTRLLTSPLTSPMPNCLAGLLDVFGRDPVDSRNQIFLRRYSARVLASNSPTSSASGSASSCVDRLRAGPASRVVAERRGADAAIERTANAFSKEVGRTAQETYECAQRLALQLAPLNPLAFDGTSTVAWGSWARAARPRGDAFAHLSPRHGIPPSTLQSFDAAVFLHRAQRERWSSLVAAQGDLSEGLNRMLDGAKLIRHATALRRLSGVIDLEGVLAGTMGLRDFKEVSLGIAHEFLAHAESLLTIAVMQRSMLAGEGWLAPLSALLEGRMSELPFPLRTNEADQAQLRREVFALLASDAGADLARNLAMFTIVRRLSATMEDTGLLDDERLRLYRIGLNIQDGESSLVAALRHPNEPWRLDLLWMPNYQSECLGFPPALGHQPNVAQNAWVLRWGLPDGVPAYLSLNSDTTGLPARVCVALPTPEQVAGALLGYPPQTEELARVRDEISADLLMQATALAFIAGTDQHRRTHALVSYIWMHTPSR